jgi:hypothetical protein
VYVLWVTCLTDGADHAVTDEDMAAGIISAAGLYPTICGTVIAPASMLSAPHPACSRCAAVLRRRAEHEEPECDPHQHSLPGIVARIFRRHREARDG